MRMNNKQMEMNMRFEEMKNQRQQENQMMNAPQGVPNFQSGQVQFL